MDMQEMAAELKQKLQDGIPKESNTTDSRYKCKYCRDTGWELYEPDERLFAKMGPDYIANSYARRCKKCQANAQAMLDHTEVPDQFRYADIGKFNFERYQKNTAALKELSHAMVNQFEEWQKESKGLYLWSKTPGSGKTFLACCIGKSAMIRTQQRMKFITAIDYLNAVSKSMKRDAGEADPSKIYRECEILIFDDIGSQQSKEWHQQEIFRLINERTAHQKVTIFTSNYPLEDLNVDDRIKSRILKSTIVIEMPEESIRDQEAIEDQRRFLQKILGK